MARTRSGPAAKRYGDALRTADRLRLSPRHRTQLEALLREHLPDVEVWAYGSRITGASHDGSDLDLVLRAPDLQKIPIGRLSDLWEALRESTIPFLVEARDWARLPEGFHGEIERDYVVLVEGARTDAAGSTAPTRVVDTEWVNSTVGEIADVFGGGTPSTKDLGNFGGDVPWITPKDLSGSPGRYVSRGARNLSKKGLDSSAARLLPAGTVLLSTRAPIGYVAVAANPVTTNQGFRNLVFKDGFSPEFYYYWLTDNVPELERHASGSTFKEISGTAVKQIKIPVPPFSEQRAIAHVLGTLDDKIELNRRMNETLEAMARALFRSWFVDFDPVRARMEGRDTGLPGPLAGLFPDRLVDSGTGPIPEGWSTGTLEDVASLNPESWNARNAPEQVAYVDLANTKWGRIERIESHRWRTAPSRARRVLRPGDTIVGTVRPGNGSFALIGRDGLTGSTAFAVLRPRTPHDRELVWCAATARGNLERLAHLADGGAYPAVRPRAVVVNTRVVLADVPVRKAFSALTARWFDRVEHNGRESGKVAALRDALLPPLVSGRQSTGSPRGSLSVR